ncbi:SIMPL domain-containing protein [Acaricomes phytoseiuli]|uniref:SIMPL domain-containing protein n=1 Tax=Acaricomes phytoseiuli TaxID=291968 RepID=UPI00039DF7DC|nr:SIMPL domain-containing protein [Acaricomes phytoseiuli]MCW1248840.1 SIMPL domain-containing protein [Acaricomes phytoseiuli]
MTAQDQQGAQTVTVTGRGSAAAAPDELTVNISIEVNRPALTTAYQDASRSMHSVQQALRDTAPAANSSTSGLSLRSETVWQEGRGSTVTGYSCSSTLTVRMPFQDDAQQAIAAIVAAGGDDVRVHGLTPDIADRSEVAERARKAAWDDAARQAGHFAELAGLQLGSVLRIAEGQDALPPAPALRQVAYAPESVMPLEAGENIVSASVTVTWQLR